MISCCCAIVSTAMRQSSKMLVACVGGFGVTGKCVDQPCICRTIFLNNKVIFWETKNRCFVEIQITEIEFNQKKVLYIHTCLHERARTHTQCYIELQMMSDAAEPKSVLDMSSAMPMLFVVIINGTEW